MHQVFHKIREYNDSNICGRNINTVIKMPSLTTELTINIFPNFVEYLMHLISIFNYLFSVCVLLSGKEVVCGEIEACVSFANQRAQLDCFDQLKAEDRRNVLLFMLWDKCQAS